ncbi:MAG: DUF2520 domain-containing protein [Ginsengibacter sp.]
MEIVMIGAGNVATVLSKLMIKNGHTILQVVNRNQADAVVLASICNAESASLTDRISTVGDMYIIAVSDTAIAGLENMDSLKGKLICHTSGSVPMSALKHISENFGVLYPLQSLSKFNDVLPEIPFLVDGNNGETMKSLLDFANSISVNVSIANDEERMKYHISAVFVHNFANHIFALAEKYCENENIDFKKLFPLMNELIIKVEKFGAAKSQTGPAVRKDFETIQKHLEILSSHPLMKKHYNSLSESIMENEQ